jgi:hypothetical protein
MRDEDSKSGWMSPIRVWRQRATSRECGFEAK